jgi:hypothetical protein
MVSRARALLAHAERFNDLLRKHFHSLCSMRAYL